MTREALRRDNGDGEAELLERRIMAGRADPGENAAGGGEARRVVALVPARETSDGAGVRLKRTIGGPGIDQLDPFLLLDAFGSEDGADYIAGFPDHPHRGFETVTYMIAGAMRHRDSTGNEGRLGPGSVQWMTAGRGIVHSEMPEQEDGLMQGFQLWVNLPARLKMSPPRYRNIPSEAVPEAAIEGGGRLRVIAGRAGGLEGPVRGIHVAPLFLDVALPAGASWEAAVPPGHACFAYVFEGTARIGGTDSDAGRSVPADTLAVLGDGSRVRLAGEAEDGRGMRLILVAARPLGEPVVRYGPFVMNTREEILQAVRDYQTGRF